MQDRAESDPTFSAFAAPQFRVVTSVLRHDASYRSFFHGDQDSDERQIT